MATRKKRATKAKFNSHRAQFERETREFQSRQRKAPKPRGRIEKAVEMLHSRGIGSRVESSKTPGRDSSGRFTKA